MSVAGSVVGATVLTYGLSRAALRLPLGLAPWARLLLAHILSLALLMLAVGFAKAYFSVFALDQTLIFVLPQLFWLTIDWLRGKADRH